MKRTTTLLTLLPIITASFLLPVTVKAQQEASSDTVIEIKITKEATDDKASDEALLQKDRPRIQIALLLDTSNSMDGLIDQAKAQLWSIVNSLVETKKDGKTPLVQVALFEYGNDKLPVTEDYLRQVVPLTTDLDKLSEALFALKTDGGSEYCGAAIGNATRVLNWEAGDGAYKAIFIAGNEPFDQGQTDFNVVCSDARSKGIVVNTIHCGPENVGVEGKWKQGADVGGGRYMVINSDKKVVSIPCPQDEVLLRLNTRLNKTYIPYGSHGKEGKARQLAQDEAQAGSSLTTRVQSKGNAALYSNATWDLLDAMKEKKVELKSLDKKTLPEAMQKMSAEDLEKHIKSLQEQRDKIQKEIAKVSKERAEYLANEIGKKAESGQEATLGDVLNRAAIEQAETRGFKK